MKPKKLEISPLQYGSPYGRIVSVPDGTLLMNIYAWMALPSTEGGPYTESSYVFRSNDSGRTWGDPALIARGYSETALLVLSGGSVLALLRNGGGIHQSVSEDKGYTWSAPKKVLPAGYHPADAIKLQSGNVLTVTGHRNPPYYGVFTMLSYDEGKTWDVDGGVLLEWESENTATWSPDDCGYPSSVQLYDGTIITMYYGVTHKGYPDLFEYAMCVRYREEEIQHQVSAMQPRGKLLTTFGEVKKMGAAATKSSQSIQP